MSTKKILLMLTVLLAACVSSASAGLVSVEVSAAASSRVEAAHPETNRSATTLDVRGDTGVKSWLKFDITPYTSDPDIVIVEAVLKLYMSAARSLERHISVSGINDDVVDNIGWTTTSITWTNAPGNDIANDEDLDPDKTTFLGLLYMPGVLNELKALDVTAFVNLDSDGIVQFALHQQGAFALTRFHSSTSASEQFRPVLEITYIPEPATIALLSLGGILLRRRKFSR